MLLASTKRSARLWLASAYLAVVLAATVGCGGDDDDDARAGETEPEAEASPSTTSTPPASDPTTTAPPGSPEGVPLALGTPAAIVDQLSGTEVGHVTIHSVTVDAPCRTSAGTPPDNGHYLDVELTVALDEAGQDTLALSGAEFRIEGPDGETEYAAGSSMGVTMCGDQPVPIAEIRPGQQYEGSILLDSAYTSGTLVFAPIVPMTELRWAY